VPPVFCITQPSFVSLVDYFLRRNWEFQNYVMINTCLPTTWYLFAGEVPVQIWAEYQGHKTSGPKLQRRYRGQS
jgi:hypothetical protein